LNRRVFAESANKRGENQKNSALSRKLRYEMALRPYPKYTLWQNWYNVIT